MISGLLNRGILRFSSFLLEFLTILLEFFEFFNNFQRDLFPFDLKIFGSRMHFLEVVADQLQVNIQGCKMFQLVQKLKAVKGALKSLNTGRFQHLNRQVDDKMTEFQGLQLLYLHNPSDTDLKI